MFQLLPTRCACSLKRHKFSVRLVQARAGLDAPAFHVANGKWRHNLELPANRTQVSIEVMSRLTCVAPCLNARKFERSMLTLRALQKVGKFHFVHRSLPCDVDGVYLVLELVLDSSTV